MSVRHLLLRGRRKIIVGVGEDPAHSLSKESADRGFSGTAYAHHYHDHRCSLKHITRDCKRADVAISASCITLTLDSRRSSAGKSLDLVDRRHRRVAGERRHQRSMSPTKLNCLLRSLAIQ